MWSQSLVVGSCFSGHILLASKPLSRYHLQLATKDEFRQSFDLAELSFIFSYVFNKKCRVERWPVMPGIIRQTPHSPPGQRKEQTSGVRFLYRFRPTIVGIFLSPYFWSFKRSPKSRNQNHLRLWDRKLSLFIISIPRGDKNERILSELALVLSGLCCL